jgi:hypothetical protein
MGYDGDIRPVCNATSTGADAIFLWLRLHLELTHNCSKTFVGCFEFKTSREILPYQVRSPEI